MFRKRLVAVCILASAVASVGLPSSSVQAQEVIDLDEGGTPRAGNGGVDIDLDEGEAPAAPGPVTAGKMSGAMSSAKVLFDEEKWNEAAQALHRVVTGETGDDAGNKQIAEYYLAISLYRLRFYQASYAIFSVISDNPNHLKFKETLLWLAKLATQLPEPADIIERVGQYTDEQVARFDNAQQRDLYRQLNYLLGRYKYRDRQYQEAIRLFQKVDRNSPHYVKAQFFTGISYVQLRKSAPAVKAFQRIVKALDEGVEGVDDEDRMRDLAHLSMARTYYSASITLDPETNAPNVNAQMLSAAVKQWNSVDAASEYWLDALFEESWAYFMAGHYPKALGNIHTIHAPYFPNAFYPEADILKAVIYFTNCNYEAASTTAARFQKRFGPLRNELEKILKKYSGENQEEAFYRFLLHVREGKGDIDERVRPIVEMALSDRQLLRNIEYVKLLEEEQRRFKRSPPAFRSSSIGMNVGDALELARDLAVRQAGELALQRYRRNLAELNERFRDVEKMFIDVSVATRNILDQRRFSTRFSGCMT